MEVRKCTNVWLKRLFSFAGVWTGTRSYKCALATLARAKQKCWQPSARMSVVNYNCDSRCLLVVNVTIPRVQKGVFVI